MHSKNEEKEYESHEKENTTIDDHDIVYQERECRKIHRVSDF